MRTVGPNCYGAFQLQNVIEAPKNLTEIYEWPHWNDKTLISEYRYIIAEFSVDGIQWIL